MKIKIIVFMIFLIPFMVDSIEIVDLNFFIEPRFEAAEIESLATIIKNSLCDSVKQVNFFAGRIMKNAESDSLVLFALNTLPCDFACPTDYFFYDANSNVSLLASNIFSDSISIFENTIIEADSFKVGIFSLYSPDFTVKNEINPNVDFEFDVFKVAEKQINILKEKTDFIILLSNLTKFIDEDIVENLPIDAVISFDYQSKRDEIFSNKRTHFYSVLTKYGKFGKLRLKYEKGKIKKEWIEEKIE